MPADGKNLIAAREMLDNRVSLGWTDLDKAFASAMQMADAKAHVVYVGDGIPVSQSVDPVAFAKKLKAMYGERRGGNPTWATFHSVATGSSFESGVLKAIASLGGGSTRKIGGEETPSHVALELMREMTQPTLRNVNVEFRGLRTASVYPAELPNVPAGMQQILLGRYLPDGRDQTGEVIVTGMLDGKPVNLIAKVDLKDAERGNSFIPRLWARMHLDALLEQGSSEAIRDEIIALSEEYNIITPYTSLLVLESDADRERFGVKKRFRMRDGEKFFAEGRDNVRFDLVQQQMKRAGTWRLNSRRQVLRELAGLGRNSSWVRQNQRLQAIREKNYDYYSLGFGSESMPASGPVSSTGAININTIGDRDLPILDSFTTFDAIGGKFSGASSRLFGGGSGGYGNEEYAERLSKSAEVRDAEEQDSREAKKELKDALSADDLDDGAAVADEKAKVDNRRSEFDEDELRQIAEDARRAACRWRVNRGLALAAAGSAAADLVVAWVAAWVAASAVSVDSILNRTLPLGDHPHMRVTSKPPAMVGATTITPFIGSANGGH